MHHYELLAAAEAMKGRPKQMTVRLSDQPWSAVAVAALLFAGVSCSSEPPTHPNKALGFRVAVISLDGLRPDAIAEAPAPTLKQLAKEGAFTLSAKTVSPTATLPAHTSMVTGLTPQHHGITWNDDTTSNPRQVAITTVFDFTALEGYTSALFVGKSKLRPLIHPGAPTKASIPPSDLWYADTVGAQVLAYLQVASPKPNFIFIHLPDIDVAGHAHGWMSPEYLAAVRHADSVVARIWEALKQTYGADLTLIVTADHGGSGFGHADGTYLDSTVPWIVWGKGVTPQTLSGVRVVDTGPTVLWLLGLAQPPDWDGVPVKSAFPTLPH